MEMPKVSVIVPVYNTEKYLKQCIDSITSQTLGEIEWCIRKMKAWVLPGTRAWKCQEGNI